MAPGVGQACPGPLGPDVFCFVLPYPPPMQCPVVMYHMVASCLCACYALSGTSIPLVPALYEMSGTHMPYRAA
eukprot:3343053-Rhodomonas_salina.1